MQAQTKHKTTGRDSAPPDLSGLLPGGEQDQRPWLMGVKAGNMAPPLKREVKGGPHGREPITNKTKWMGEVRVDPSFCGVHLMSRYMEYHLSEEDGMTTAKLSRVLSGG